MSQQVSNGFIDLTSGQRAPTFRVPVKSTLGRLILRLTGNLVVTAAATLREDGILRLLKRIELDIGGVRVKTIGDGNALSGAGPLLYYMNQFYYGSVPQLSQPAVGVATNAFSATLSIPFEMPPALSNQYPQNKDFSGRNISMLSPTEKEIELNVDWGAVADVISAGTATLSATRLEVISVVYPQFDSVQMPLLLHENTKQATLSTGANADERTEMDRVGVVPAIGILSFDNTVRDDGVFNGIDAIINGNNHVYDMSWEAMRANAKEQSGLAAVTEGAGMVVFDREENLQGALVLDAGDVKNFQMSIDHAALTATWRVLLHVLSLQKQG